MNFLSKDIKAEKISCCDGRRSLSIRYGSHISCIASKAGIEFPKAVGVATATYVQVIEGKHGGLLKELGEEKLDRKKLFAGAEFQIVTTAIQYCPDSVPKDIKKKVKKIVKENSKK